MEKRFTLALVLSLLVLFLYQTFILGPDQQRRREAAEKARLEKEAKEKADEAANAGGAGTDPDKPAPTVNKPPQEVRADLLKDAQTVTIENDRLSLDFSSAGGVLREARLKDFRPTAQSEEGDHLRLLVPSTVGLDAMRIDDASQAGLGLGSSLWTTEISPDRREVTFSRRATWSVNDSRLGYTFKKTFRLPEGERSDVEVTFSFTPDELQGKWMTKTFNMLLTGGVFQEFGGDTLNGPRSAYYPFEEEVELVPAGSLKPDEVIDVRKIFDDNARPRDQKRLDKGDRFVADLSIYHGVFFLPREFPSITTSVNLISRGFGHFDDRGDSGGSQNRTCTVLTFTASDVELNKSAVWKGVLYLGPIDKTAIAERLEGVVSADEIDALSEVHEDQLGWARFIGRIILGILRFMHGITGNWGWAIVLLTLCVRIVLFPVNRKSQAAMLVYNEKMAKLKPKLEALKKKHEGDSKKFAEEQMKLMREHGLGLPLGGCLPIFLQIPIFFGLFSALRASIELRQAPWIWVKDLSQADHLITFDSPMFNPIGLCAGCCNMPVTDITGFHLLPILMTIAWVLNSMLMPRPESSTPQMEQQRKMMMFMPILFGLMMYNYAAGLSLYWLTSSLFGIVESRVIKKIWPVKPADPKAKPRTA